MRKTINGRSLGAANERISRMNLVAKDALVLPHTGDQARNLKIAQVL